MKKQYSLGPGSQKVYDSGLHPDLKSIIDEMLDVSPMDFTLVSGVRTEKEQHALWAIGRTYNNASGLPRTNPDAWHKTGNVVTWCDGYRKKSNHQGKDDGYGHAFDFQCYIPGRNDLAYDKIHMAVMVGAFLTTANALYVRGIIDHLLRSGADWDGDTQYLEPGTFIDMPHLELIKP